MDFGFSTYSGYNYYGGYGGSNFASNLYSGGGGNNINMPIPSSNNKKPQATVPATDTKPSPAAPLVVKLPQGSSVGPTAVQGNQLLNNLGFRAVPSKGVTVSTPQVLSLGVVNVEATPPAAPLVVTVVNPQVEQPVAEPKIETPAQVVAPPIETKPVADVTMPDVLAKDASDPVVVEETTQKLGPVDPPRDTGPDSTSGGPDQALIVATPENKENRVPDMVTISNPNTGGAEQLFAGTPGSPLAPHDDQQTGALTTAGRLGFGTLQTVGGLFTRNSQLVLNGIRRIIEGVVFDAGNLSAGAAEVLSHIGVGPVDPQGRANAAEILKGMQDALGKPMPDGTLPNTDVGDPIVSEPQTTAENSVDEATILAAMNQAIGSVSAVSDSTASRDGISTIQAGDTSGTITLAENTLASSFDGAKVLADAGNTALSADENADGTTSAATTGEVPEATAASTATQVAMEDPSSTVTIASDMLSNSGGVGGESGLTFLSSTNVSSDGTVSDTANAPNLMTSVFGAPDANSIVYNSISDLLAADGGLSTLTLTDVSTMPTSDLSSGYPTELLNVGSAFDQLPGVNTDGQDWAQVVRA